MGDFRFRSLLFQFLEALTKPVQPFSLRKRHIRIRPHNCTDSAHGIPKFTLILMIVLIVWLIGVLIAWLLGGLGGGLMSMRPEWLFFGLLFGLIFGLAAPMQHYILRFWLSCTHTFPWKAVPFLDDATARILLRRVGGGYQFTHRLLLDYFADLDAQASPASTTVLSTPSPAP